MAKPQTVNLFDARSNRALGASFYQRVLVNKTVSKTV